ncbi:MAG: peptide ABC transporter substrate-binding protein [Eubacteriales bacterium]|nr:peptide ABC transporter substrate-binding protein [Eubacteriales bacterium]
MKREQERTRRVGPGAKRALCALLCAAALLASGCSRQPTVEFEPMPTPAAVITPAPTQDVYAPAQPVGGVGGDLTVSADPLDQLYAGQWSGQPADGMEQGYAPMQRGDINIGLVLEDQAVLHPLKCTHRDLISMNELVFESVIELDDNLQPVGQLADSWSNTGATYTFHLRSGVQFHNGQPLSAQDVYESWRYIVAQGENGPWYDRVQLIEEMKVLSTDVLEVEFVNPGFLSLYAMTFPVVYRYSLDYALPMGTGPYWYTNYSVDQYLRLEANPFWWKKAAKAKSISGWRYPDTASAQQALLTGEIDTLATRSGHVSLYKKLSEYNTVDYSTNIYEMLVPNITSGAMSDLRMRQAVMYAVDRTTIAETIYGNMVQESEVPVVPGSYLYETQAAQYNYSPERALQLLHEIGWTDTNGDTMLDTEVDGLLENFTIRLVTYNDNLSNARSDAAYLIAEQMEKIGVTVEIETVTKSKMANVFKKGEFDLALIAVNLPYTPDLSRLLMHDGKLNSSGYASKDMNNLLVTARSAQEVSELQAIFSQIQLKIVNELPFLGMYFHTGAVISTAQVRSLHGLQELNTWRGMELVEP